jgi:hypothetical protein
VRRCCAARSKCRTTAARTLLLALALGLLAAGISRAQILDEAPRALPPFLQTFVEWLQSRNKPTAIMEPREVALVSRAGTLTRLRVPIAYIDRGGGRELIEDGSRDRPGGFVSIVAYLPDLKPRYLAEQARDKPSIGGLLFDDNEHRLGLVVSAANPENWTSKVERTKRYYTFDRDDGEFHVYFDVLRSRHESERRRWKEILIPIGAEDAIIDCALGRVGQRLGCEVSIPQEDIVQVKFMMWNTQLGQWRSIVAKAVSFTKTLIVRS